MKKNLLLASILLTSVALVACSNQVKTQANSSKTTSSSSSQDSTSSSSVISTQNSEESQVIGSDEYGFVKVPKSWVRFNEVQGGNVFNIQTVRMSILSP